MKQIYLAVACIQLFVVTANAQSITVFKETFPNQFNTGFGVPATNNPNTSFVGSTGTWAGSGGTLASIAVVPAYYSAVTNAIKIVNWNTSGLAAGYCSATSPKMDISNYNCAPVMNFTFKLYTYACNASDPNSTLKVEFSADDGNTWAAVYTISSAQIFNNWGANNLTTISIPVTAGYRAANFRYRFSGYKPANQGNNFYLFIDDPQVLADACGTSLELGNLVWDDKSLDGHKQGNESGISGVTVNLYLDANNDNLPDGPAINSQQTNSSGIYSFANLAAGNYIIGVVTPAGYTKGLIDGGDPDNNIDNDNNGNLIVGSEIRGSSITLSSSSNSTYDFGLVGSGSLGDFIWNDNNRNGLQDPGESGLANKTILLKNAAGTATLRTTQTDANGRYRFDNLAPGTYTLKFPGISAMVPTPALVGNNMEINSKPNPGNSSYQVNLAAGEANLTIDAGYNSGPTLPIIMGDFNAYFSNGFAQLRWNTSAEYNSSHFEVDRSSDGTDFEVIGRADARGNSYSRTEYSFSDLLTNPGINYYRLKMVDIDGSFEYSKVVVLNTDMKGVNLLLVYPNPFGHKVQLKVESQIKSKVQIRVLNSAGAVIRLQDEILNKGINIILVKNVSELPGGVYYLEIKTEQKTLTTKIMKQ